MVAGFETPITVRRTGAELVQVIAFGRSLVGAPGHRLTLASSPVPVGSSREQCHCVRSAVCIEVPSVDWPTSVSARRPRALRTRVWHS